MKPLFPRWIALCLTAIAATALAVHVTASSMPVAPTGSTSPGRHAATHRPIGIDQEDYGLSASYYSVRSPLRSRVIINNKSVHVMHPHVTLYARDGRHHTVTNITVGPRTFVDLDLAPMAAEAGDGFEDGSLRLSYTGQSREMGGQVRITDAEHGVGFDEMFAYPQTAVSNRLEAVWWLPDNEAGARLVVTNTTGSALDVHLRLDQRPQPLDVHLGPWELRVIDLGQSEPILGVDQQRTVHGASVEYGGEPGAVLAHGFVANPRSGYSRGIFFIDPRAAKTSTYQGSAIHVGRLESSPTSPPLDQVILARNLGDHPVDITGRLQVQHLDGELEQIELPRTTLGTRQARALDFGPEFDRAASVASLAGIELEYNAAPGSVIVAAETVASDRNTVFRVPLDDPATIHSSTGGYYLEAAGTTSAVAYIKNVTSEVAYFTYQINYDEGVWAPGRVQVVKPHETVKIDFGAIRDNAVKDAKGRTIPADVARAQLHWSVVRQTSNDRVLIGRAEEFDPEEGIASTAACEFDNSDWYCDNWSDSEDNDIQIPYAGQAYASSKIQMSATRRASRQMSRSRWTGPIVTSRSGRIRQTWRRIRTVRSGACAMDHLETFSCLERPWDATQRHTTMNR